ncbi:J domain-containing protein [Thermoactinomyces sp. CICC 23799]|uniref:J domain-containing protein n=1 Tax=Thermoactinomyces sp. CICC 23799 TaxID=2767429 RepID=UPI00351B9FEB
MKYFSNVQSLDDLKQQFKKLAKKYHPDVQGGSNEIMKQVNAEYEYLKKLLHEQVGKRKLKRSKCRTLHYVPCWSTWQDTRRM